MTQNIPSFKLNQYGVVSKLSTAGQYPVPFPYLQKNTYAFPIPYVSKNILHEMDLNKTCKIYNISG
jgi:hypothetical protein